MWYPLSKGSKNAYSMNMFLGSCLRSLGKKLLCFALGTLNETKGTNLHWPVIMNLPCSFPKTQEQAKQPESCSLLGQRTAYSLIEETNFKKVVEKIAALLESIDRSYTNETGTTLSMSFPGMYFAFKDACEVKLNQYAGLVNGCPSCYGLNAPLPTYPTAGKNFEQYALLDSNLR